MKKSLRNLSSLLQSYLLLLNSFLFLSRFSATLKSLSNYVFRRFAYKSLLNRFSVLINYIMWFSSPFSTSSCFLQICAGFSGFRFFEVQVFQDTAFSESRFFKVQVFQGPGTVWLQVLEVAYTFTIYLLILKSIEKDIEKR